MQAAIDARRPHAASLSLMVKTHFLCSILFVELSSTVFCVSVNFFSSDLPIYKANLEDGDRSALSYFF